MLHTVNLRGVSKLAGALQRSLGQGNGRSAVRFRGGWCLSLGGKITRTGPPRQSGIANSEGLGNTSTLRQRSATVAPSRPFSPPDRQSSNLFGSISLSDSRFGFVSFTSSGTPSPSLVASANIGPNSTIPSIFGRAAGVLSYVFEILGPTGSVPALIDAAGLASAAAGPGASFAVASIWTLFDSTSLSNVLAGDEIRSGQLTGSFNQSFNHTVGLTLTTNHIFAVFMLADAAAAATDVGSHAAADALVDPIFSFGLGVDPSLYSFNFSPGIGNSPAVAGVPGPSTLAIYSVGLLFLVFARRRRTA